VLLGNGSGKGGSKRGSAGLASRRATKSARGYSQALFEQPALTKEDKEGDNIHENKEGRMGAFGRRGKRRVKKSINRQCSNLGSGFNGSQRPSKKTKGEREGVTEEGGKGKGTLRPGG